MKMLPGKSATPIGIDVGSQHVKMVQLSGRPRRWRIEVAACLTRDQPGISLEESDVRRMCDVLIRRGFHGRRVVLTVPAHKLLAGMLELPRVASGVPVQQIARMELARTHRRDPHSFELAYWNLPTRVRPSDASQVYAAACPHDDANSYLDLFESQGLDVVALDVQSTALTRACSALISNAANVTAILDVGWLSARLVLVHDGVIVFERTFEEGGVEPVHRVLGHRFSLQPQVIEQLLRRAAPAGQSQDSPLEELLSESRSILAAQFDAIVQELQVSFSYIAHQFPDAAVDQVLLVGGGAMMPGMCDYLNNTLNVKTRPARACDLAACDPAYAELGNSGALTIAVGLAQWRA